MATFLVVVVGMVVVVLVAEGCRSVATTMTTTARRTGVKHNDNEQESGIRDHCSSAGICLLRSGCIRTATQ